MAQDSDDRDRQRARRDGPDSLLLLGAVAVASLWAVLLIPGAVLAELVVRMPGIKCPEWLAYVWVLGAFLVSGITTMLASRRWLPAASGHVAVVKSVVVLASVSLLSFAAFVCGGALLMGDTAGLGSFYAVGMWCVLWLCWVAGGLVVALRKAHGAGRKHEGQQ